MTSTQAKLHHLGLSLQELLWLFSGISQTQFGMSQDRQMTFNNTPVMLNFTHLTFSINGFYLESIY